MIIDFHTHIFSPEVIKGREFFIKKDLAFSNLYGTENAKMIAAPDLIQEMDLSGIDVSVVMGIGWSDYQLAHDMNDYISESVLQYPDRLVGFGSINPCWGELAVYEMERCQSIGLKGLGELHPHLQNFRLDNYKIMLPIVETVQKLDWIITTHSSEPVGHLYDGKGDTYPQQLAKFIEMFQEVKIILAHWGGGLPFYALMPEIMTILNNVYFDIAASPFLYSKSILPVVVKLVGAHKILLASDFPLLRMKKLLELVQNSDILDQEKKEICGENAAKLLGI